MNFYFYNNKIVHQNRIPNDIDYSSLEMVPIHNDIDDKNHFINVNIDENTIIVKIGENGMHPMNEDECIEFIILEIDNKIINEIYLNKNAEPTAVFMLQNININELQKNHLICIYVCCNKTGIWSKKI